MLIGRKFSQVDRGTFLKYPNPHTYKSVRDKSLWALHVLKQELSFDNATASDVANFLTEVVQISTSQQAVSYALGKAPRGYLSRKKGAFKLMRKGMVAINLVNENDGKIEQLYLQAGTPHSGKVQFVELVLPELKGDIRICDPYVGAGLLDILSKGDKSNTVRILTKMVEDKPMGSFMRALEDVNREGYAVSVRMYQASDLHDRYIIADGGLWLVGHSIKDLGKKESFIIKASEDIKQTITTVFERRWNCSNAI